MRNRARYLLYAVVLAFLAACAQAARPGMLVEGPDQAGRPSRAQGSDDRDRPADREAIARLGQEFHEAFDKHDAKALAALYTEQCEYYDDTNGEAFRGRAEVEKAYQELFRARPACNIDPQERSLRFVARDTALLDALVHVRSRGPELPISTRCSCVLVREDGQWKIALEREWGEQDERLEDLAWLIGEWAARPGNRELAFSFRWNDKKTMIVGHFTVKEAGRETLTGTQRIGVDPQSDRIHSWLIDQHGGRGQSRWMRDGKSWLLDAVGTQPSGVETSSVNIITRISDDAFTWRSINRRIGADELPPTEPVKVTRVKSSN
jgi:uncharacterized protein (TIGR02246 family)